MFCIKCKKPILDKNKIFYGLHQKCFQEWFGLEAFDEFIDLAIRSSSQTPHQEKKINSSFFHGKFRKYSARLGGTGYILKVLQNEYPELPVTEYVCNQIYQELKISIAPFFLVHFPENRFCFVTKNFMSGLINSSLVHVYHFIDSKSDYDCEALIRIIGKITGRRTDQERFVFLTLADSLVGNNDRHGRNLGFIQSPTGMTLAPFYDNPSALGVEDELFLGADLQPRGVIFTKDSNEPTMYDYVCEWNRLGYNDVIKDFKNKLSINNIKKIVEKSYLSDKRQKALIKLILNRNEQLCRN